MGDNLSKCPVCGADEDYLSSNGALMQFKCGSRYFYKWPEYPESLCTNIVRDFIAQRVTIATLTEQRDGLLEVARQVDVLFSNPDDYDFAVWDAKAWQLKATIAVVEEEMAATLEPMPVPGNDKYDVYLPEEG